MANQIILNVFSWTKNWSTKPGLRKPKQKYTYKTSSCFGGTCRCICLAPPPSAHARAYTYKNTRCAEDANTHLRAMCRLPRFLIGCCSSSTTIWAERVQTSDQARRDPIWVLVVLHIYMCCLNSAVIRYPGIPDPQFCPRPDAKCKTALDYVESKSVLAVKYRPPAHARQRKQCAWFARQQQSMMMTVHPGAFVCCQSTAGGFTARGAI